jgi:hypothetical protein
MQELRNIYGSVDGLRRMLAHQEGKPGFASGTKWFEPVLKGEDFA